jgi:hypothetical protein
MRSPGSAALVGAYSFAVWQRSGNGDRDGGPAGWHRPDAGYARVAGRATVAAKEAPSLASPLASAHETAPEVRVVGDYTKGQTIVKLQAAIVAQQVGNDLTAGGVADAFRAEVWRLARH